MARAKPRPVVIDGEVVRVPAGDQWAVVDIEDRAIVEGVCWFVGKHGYVVRNIRRDDGSWGQIRLQCLVMDMKNVDHVDRDRLNNRRSNLRPANRAQQVRNRNKRADTSSPYKGVRRNGRSKSWVAQIVSDRKRHYLGSFRTAEEAARAYDEAARQLHGEFAATNADLGLLPD